VLPETDADRVKRPTSEPRCDVPGSSKLRGKRDDDEKNTRDTQAFPRTGEPRDGWAFLDVFLFRSPYIRDEALTYTLLEGKKLARLSYGT
jgi:hypothetical protein